MTKVTIDENGSATIPYLNETFEFCDKAGHVVGLFVPTEDSAEAVYTNLVVPFSEEELQRRELDADGCSLNEFWQRLDEMVKRHTNQRPDERS